MKNKTIYFVITLLFISMLGCKKSSTDESTSPTNLLSKVVGTYYGTMTGGQSTQSWIKISQEQSTSNVRIGYSTDNTSYADLGLSFTLSDAGSGTISITTSLPSENGTVTGNSLSFYLGPQHFTGTKQ